MDLSNELINLYEMWLMDNYPEDVTCKDRLIELSEEGYMRDEFIKEVNEVLD